jgi:hypothetical protein
VASSDRGHPTAAVGIDCLLGGMVRAVTGIIVRVTAMIHFEHSYYVLDGLLPVMFRVVAAPERRKSPRSEHGPGTAGSFAQARACYEETDALLAGEGGPWSSAAAATRTFTLAGRLRG